MTPSPAEKQIRAGLPMIRFLNGYLPLSISRWMIAQSVARLKLPADISHQTVDVDGVPCHWLIPQNADADQVLLYLHGGGFVLGLTGLHMEMVAQLARRTGVRALMVDYRLAPEHPFPAALDDCVVAYRWLLQQGVAPHNIVIAGDSAGGNLTLTTLMKLRDDGDPLPAAAAALSPVTDFVSKEKRFEETYDPILHPRATRLYNKSYVAGRDPHDPLMSPAFGDWRGLPPLLIHAGEDEVLREDAIAAADAAKAAGVNVRLEIYPRMWHVWQINLALPQAQQSLDDIAQFLAQQKRSTDYID
ncbi:MAG: alpha/beta hydrolase [Caldilineaceae bacterium]